MINIKLNYNYGYKWFDNNEIYVKGYLFDKNDNLYSEEHLISYFENIETKNDFEKKLQEANGIFAVIIKKEAMTFVAADRTRTFPLFYSQKNDDIYISDDTYHLKNILNSKINELSANEYLSTGYVTGKDTLLENIYQIQAGEYIAIDKSIEQNFYFDYITNWVTDKDYKSLENEFIEILDRVAKRLIAVANGRQIVLPLSGGYDSRLIASLLKKHKYENVFCFTYGSKESFEVKISQKVAEALEYKWCFVEYNEETIPSNYPNTEVFQNYYKFASNHVSIFLTQDYFAVKHLVDNNIIETDSLIVPGHSGDFLAGSHLAKTEIASPNNIVNVLLKKHYVLKDIDNRVVKQLSNRFNKVYTDTPFYYSVDEDFNLKERQSKFIVNANRVYEYFNHTHSIPLWDSELIEFFRVLPLDYKLNSYFFEKVIFEKEFIGKNIDFKKPIPSKSIYKKILKKYLPTKIKNFIVEMISRDDNNLNLIHKPIQNEVAKKYLVININSLLAFWYLGKVKSESSI